MHPQCFHLVDHEGLEPPTPRFEVLINAFGIVLYIVLCVDISTYCTLRLYYHLLFLGAFMYL